MHTISHHSALIYVMVVISASDGAMTDGELEAIGRRVRTLPVFRDFDPDRLVAVAQECAAILQDDDGLNAVLGLVAEALPMHLRETAYYLALEMALTDTSVRLEEIRVIERLRHALGLEKLIAAALERGARARYQTA
ncbi:MAG: tellurite resistance TerB family protein [Pseudomonadota bacterium]|nr:tellurite resistance TerB family protein [Pseudomonadota bacterium]